MSYQSRIVGGSKSVPLPLDLLECVGLHEALVAQEVCFQLDRQQYALRNESNPVAGVRVSSEMISRKYRGKISASAVRTCMQTLKKLGVVVEIEPASGVLGALVDINHERAAQLHQMGWDAVQGILTANLPAKSARKSKSAKIVADTTNQLADTTNQLDDSHSQQEAATHIIPNKNNNKNTDSVASPLPEQQAENSPITPLLAQPEPSERKQTETASEPQTAPAPITDTRTNQKRALVAAWRSLGGDVGDADALRSIFAAMQAHAPTALAEQNQTKIEEWIKSNGHAPRRQQGPQGQQENQVPIPASEMTKPPRQGLPVALKTVPFVDKNANKIPQEVRVGFNFEDVKCCNDGQHFTYLGRDALGRHDWRWSKEKPSTIGADDVVKMMRAMKIPKTKACAMLGVDPAIVAHLPDVLAA